MTPKITRIDFGNEESSRKKDRLALIGVNWKTLTVEDRLQIIAETLGILDNQDRFTGKGRGGHSCPHCRSH